MSSSFSPQDPPLPDPSLPDPSLPDPSLPDTELVTDRLVLRPWSTDEITRVVDGGRTVHWAADFPAEGDRAVAGHIAEQSGKPGAYGHRLVVERESGLVVGSISVFWPPSDGALEVGYGIVPSRRGRGYAAEATRALVESVLGSFGVHTVYADVELTNPASVRVLEKAGLHRWSEDAGTARFRTTVRDMPRR